MRNSGWWKKGAALVAAFLASRVRFSLFHATVFMALYMLAICMWGHFLMFDFYVISHGIPHESSEEQNFYKSLMLRFLLWDIPSDSGLLTTAVSLYLEVLFITAFVAPVLFYWMFKKRIDIPVALAIKTCRVQCGIGAVVLCFFYYESGMLFMLPSKLYAFKHLMMLASFIMVSTFAHGAGLVLTYYYFTGKIEIELHILYEGLIAGFGTTMFLIIVASSL